METIKCLETEKQSLAMAVGIATPSSVKSSEREERGKREEEEKKTKASTGFFLKKNNNIVFGLAIVVEVVVDAGESNLIINRFGTKSQLRSRYIVYCRSYNFNLCSMFVTLFFNPFFRNRH